MLPPIGLFSPWPGSHTAPPRRVLPVAPAKPPRPLGSRVWPESWVEPDVWSPGPSTGRGHKALLAYGALERRERLSMLSSLLGIDLYV